MRYSSWTFTMIKISCTLQCGVHFRCTLMWEPSRRTSLACDFWVCILGANILNLNNKEGCVYLYVCVWWRGRSREDEGTAQSTQSHAARTGGPRAVEQRGPQPPLRPPSESCAGSALQTRRKRQGEQERGRGRGPGGGRWGLGPGRLGGADTQTGDTEMLSRGGARGRWRYLRIAHTLPLFRQCWKGHDLSKPVFTAHRW